MSQRRICYVYILTLDHSYDQVLQANASKKMLAILVSMSSVEVTSDDVEQFRIDFFEEGARLTNNQIKDRIVQSKTEVLYNQQFGIRSSRRE